MFRGTQELVGVWTTAGHQGYESNEEVKKISISSLTNAYIEHSCLGPDYTEVEKRS